MPQYVRAFVPGCRFFFTVTPLERRRKLLTEHIANLELAADDNVRGLELE
jgi:REP element-mobilizing transposase RayT